MCELEPQPPVIIKAVGDVYQGSKPGGLPCASEQHQSPAGEAAEAPAHGQAERPATSTVSSGRDPDTCS